MIDKESKLNKLTSKMGNLSEFHWLMRSELWSTIVIVTPGHLCAITAHVGPPTYPAPMQQTFRIIFLWENNVKAIIKKLFHSVISETLIFIKIWQLKRISYWNTLSNIISEWSCLFRSETIFGRNVNQALLAKEIEPEIQKQVDWRPQEKLKLFWELIEVTMTENK